MRILLLSLILALFLPATDIVVTTGADPLVNGDNFQTALTAAVCGDNIILQGGSTYATRTSFIGGGGPVGPPFNAPNKGACAGSYITIKPADLSALPGAGVRISIPYKGVMPKLATNNNDSVLQFAQNTNYWRVIGIIFTNTTNVGANNNGHTPSLVNADIGAVNTHPHHIEFDRCMFYPVEMDGTPGSYRTVTRGIGLNGAEIVARNSYFYGFTGWYINSTTMVDSECMIMDVGPGPWRFINNYCEAWFNELFSGGAEFPPSTNTATLASGATSTQATFSQVANLQVNDFVSFQMPVGEYKVGKVSAINGNVVTYAGYGPSAITSDPSVPGDARWRGQSITDIEIRGSTFYKNPDDVKYGQSKAHYEIKIGEDVVIAGNRWLGHGSDIGITVRNQGGNAPWSTVRNVLIENNYGPGLNRVTINLDDELRTVTQGKDITVSNNIISNPYLYPIGTKAGDNILIKHNTFRGHTNSIMFGSAPVQSNVILRDNIANCGTYGFNCTSGAESVCWSPFTHNNSVWIGSCSLPPDSTAANDAAVQFVNAADADAGGDYHGYALAAGSPYKNTASDGKDPGVDFTALDAALGGTASSRVTGRVNVTGRVRVQ